MDLFSGITFKDMALKNRIVMAPMCQYSAGDQGYAEDWHRIHYSTRAIGGVGLILLEATAVEPRGRISARDLGIWSDDHVPGLQSVVNLCHEYGSKVGIQLAHAGRKCDVETESIVAPSAIAFNEKYPVPEALSIAEIQGIVEAFAKGARRALAAGFDTIEIHAAHGYLINEFLSPLTNQRQDQYGGNLENRTRFLGEVLAAVRQEWPLHKPLIVRVSAEDYVPQGNHPEDLAETLKLLKQYEIDLINVSSGAVVPAKIEAFSGYQIPFAEVIRTMTGIPTIGGGLIDGPEMAQEVIKNGRSDLIYLGRELLRNPYWTIRAGHMLGAEVPWPYQYERGK